VHISAVIADSVGVCRYGEGVLTELRITGLGVIDDAVLEPHAGLTAVTGETGAGKTMVVTALGLLTGGRADAGRVRAGADRAVVEARAQLPTGHAAAAVVEAAGGRPDDDGSIILVRSVSADGRSRAHAGGRSVPVATLAEVSDPLVAVHGQSEAISLLRPGQQRAVLDRYAHSEPLLHTYRAARSTWQQAVAELTDRTERARERAQREQMLRLGLEEIDKVDPKPGEDEDILAEVRRLENVDVLRAAAENARGVLSGDVVTGDAATAVGLVDAARRDLASVGDERLTGWAASLHQAAAVLVDAAADLSAYLDELDADPERLESLLSRQAVLRTLTRRYGVDVDAVLRWRDEAAAELVGLDSSEEALTALRSRCDELAAATAKAGAALTRHRARAAEKLAAAATAELEHLAMGRAVLRVAVTGRTVADRSADAVQVGGQWCVAGPDGLDSVEFLMRSHRAAPELPVAKSASGGELSRVMLAVEVVLADADPVATLVFDEVDAGVGGRAATEIGRRLARLAMTHQVIVVTHLAQVAAFADRQVVVNASEDGAVRVSSLREVCGPDREAELARMLGGTEGEVARAHAADLLAAAHSAAPAESGPVADQPTTTRKRKGPSGSTPAAATPKVATPKVATPKSATPTAATQTAAARRRPKAKAAAA
jgi:DNA repair protein RecN (Recombination protein N)